VDSKHQADKIYNHVVGIVGKSLVNPDFAGGGLRFFRVSDFELSNSEFPKQLVKERLRLAGFDMTRKFFAKYDWETRSQFFYQAY